PTSTRPGFLGTLRGHGAAIYALAISEEGWLASGARDHQVNLWNLSARAGASTLPSRPGLRLEGHKAGVTALAFAPKVLVSGSADNTTRIWELPSGRTLHVIAHPKTVFGVAIRPPEESSDGEFATACWDGVVRTFDLRTGSEKAIFDLHQGGLYSVAYSPLDGSLLATASADRTVRIWDLRRMELLWTLRGHKDHVTSVDWSPSKPYTLASGSWDRRFRLWEIPTQEVEGCRSALACSSSLAPKWMARHPQLIWRVAFAPGGTQVATCHGAVGQSPTVVIYDAASGRVLRQLGRHKDTPLTIAWSPDGLYLASAGMDRKVLLYDSQHPDD
ncbi:unnamed protein product, partial [Polarella glacialis]